MTCKVLLIALTEGGTLCLLFGIGRMDAAWSLRLSGKTRGALMLLCAASAVDIAGRMGGQTLWAQCLTGVFAGCLLAASVMDRWERMVYRFVWWVAGGAAGLLLLMRCARPGGLAGSLCPLLLFGVIQQGLFGRLYGRADCDAFFVCAAAFAAFGMGFGDYVMHMAVTFGGLALVQAVKRNISADGNLKKPVPLVPYITAAFWVWVDFMT